MRPHRLAGVLSLVFSLLISACSKPESRQLEVLILTGENNHNWRLTTPELLSLLNENGRFKVTVVENIEAMTPKSFEGYDVIVSNYNTFKSKKPVEEIWKFDVREAFLKHIRDGAGFVVVHAGSSGFYDWPEFHDLAITTWTLGKTRHGSRHAEKVRLDTSHPITKGMKDFWTFDEFWETLTIQENAKAYAWVTPHPDFKGSGEEQPSLLVRDYGKGRVVTLLLGHDFIAMRNPGFRALFSRGVEWAGSGKVSIQSTDGPQTKEEAEAVRDAAAAEAKK